ncbi:MAG: hypothetical protein N2Z59_03870, partial [Alteraurantiacibacter sp.]|nr:hypothetical protein [Alteraurantiacibacter sp.]
MIFSFSSATVVSTANAGTGRGVVTGLAAARGLGAGLALVAGVTATPALVGLADLTTAFGAVGLGETCLAGL